MADKPEIGALTIKEFCAKFKISVEFFHKLQREGNGPAVMKIGAKRLISYEAAETWRRKYETLSFPKKK